MSPSIGQTGGRTGSPFQIADSMTLLSAVHWRLGDTSTAWARILEALAFFPEVDSASGLARALGLAAVVLLANGDAERGARITGAVQRLVREKGVMLAPVTVLHLPDPSDLAVERLGTERATELLAEGESNPGRRHRRGAARHGAAGPGPSVTSARPTGPRASIVTR